MTKKISNSKFPKIEQIKTLDGYDFLDLGAGDGGSLVNIENVFGGKGIGIEFSKVKVEKAIKLSRNVYLGDALKLDGVPGKVDFITCDNFLEHLQSIKDVEKMLKQALKKANNFIYIRHPSFDHNEYLSSLGLKTYWSDWTGHTAMVKTTEFVDMFIRMGITTFMIVPVGLIKNSDDDRVLPISAMPDQFGYLKEQGIKPKVSFDREVYYAFDIIAMVPGSEMKIPELKYTDRLGKSKHPKISYFFEGIELRHKVEIDKIMSRRSVKVANKLNKILRRV